MKKYISMIAASLMMVSCIDTIILPEDKTVDEDFWQTKNDVSSMVNAAYSAFASYDMVERMIVWGDFRSDELVLGSSAIGYGKYDELAEMAAVNMQTTNSLAAWASVYSVINRCNIVLERAKAVMEIDPNYTQGDYDTDRSQMLALRALCYFYLVRNYRDVPYITEAYMNSSQNMQVAQSTPAYVLEQCIADLEEAAKTPIYAYGVTVGWQRVGWLTSDGINSLLADIYLWRASLTHNANDYQRCIDYCDLVIDSKRSQHVRGRNEVEEKEYPLADAVDTYTDLYVNQNAEESIFEMQINKNNLAWVNYFYKYHGSGDAEGYMKATNIFGSAASKVVNVSGSQVFSSNDLRYYASCFDVTSDGNLNVRKWLATNAVTSMTSHKRPATSDYGAIDANYIVYKLSDVMLMKAEALVQQVDTNMERAEQERLLFAPFKLVQAVNTRSLYQNNLTDSMTWGAPCNYKNYTKEGMEELVMQERLRELCFEGKRWYDLMRYNYRHVDYDADKYNRLLVELNESHQLGTISPDMKTLMVRGDGADGAAVAAKMQNEAYLYLPVPNSDIIVCPLLRQNPVYKNTNNYEKAF